MSRPGVTKEDVNSAKALLLRQGKAPSIRNIVEITGGSNTTVRKHLLDIREEEKSMLGESGRVKTQLGELVDELHDLLKADSDRQVREGEERCAARIKEIQEQLDEVKSGHQATLKELADVTAKLAEKELQLQDLTERFNATNIELKRQGQALEDTQMNLEAERRTSSKLSHDLDRTLDAQDRYTRQTAELRKQEQTTFENTLASLRADNRKLSEKNIDIAGSVAELNNQNGSLTAKLGLLETRLVTMESEADHAHAQKQAAERQITDLRIELGTVKSLHTEVARQLELATVDRRRVDEALFEAKSTIQSKDSDLQRLERQVQELNAKLEAARPVEPGIGPAPA